MSAEHSSGVPKQKNFFPIVEDNGEFTSWCGWPKDYAENAKNLDFSRTRRLTVEDFIVRYNVPLQRMDAKNNIVTLGSPDTYPGGEALMFVDRKTGLISQEIIFIEINWEDYLRDVRDPNVNHPEKRYKPWVINTYDYRDVEIDHPVLNEKVKGILTTVTNWDIDRLYRRRGRGGLSSVFATYEDNWDSESGFPRRMDGLIYQSVFKEVESDTQPTSIFEPVEYIEDYRSYFLGSHIFVYVSIGDPPHLVYSPIVRLTFDEEEKQIRDCINIVPHDQDIYNVGNIEIVTDDILKNLGDPRRVMFMAY
jgi:hypothetical protein